MKKINVVAIDGPSASGKGALSRSIAHRFGFDILDSGLLYRLYAYLSHLKFDIDEINKKISKDISFISEEDSVHVIYQGNEITNHLH